MPDLVRQRILALANSGGELADLILSHYDQFDSKYKALILFKRVYVPEPL